MFRFNNMIIMWDGRVLFPYMIALLFCSKKRKVLESFWRISVKKHNLSINCVRCDAIYLSCHLSYERLERYISVRRNKSRSNRTLYFCEKIWGLDSCTYALVYCIYSMTKDHKSIIWFRTSPLFQSKGEYSTAEGVSGANGHARMFMCGATVDLVNNEFRM